METFAQLIKGQESELMKYLLGAKEMLSSGLGNEEMLKKASEMIIKASEKYENLKKFAENATDFQRKIIENKAEAYRIKANEIKIEIERIKESKNDENRGNPQDTVKNALALSVNTQDIGVSIMEKLKSQGNSIQKFAVWSIKSEDNDSSSALIDLYIKKSKIKVSMIIIILLQVFIFLLVLKLKLS